VEVEVEVEVEVAQQYLIDKILGRV